MGWLLNGGVWIMTTMTIISFVQSKDHYRFFDWKVTFGTIKPVGSQKGILINGKFPGPEIHAVTNDHLIINVHNHLDEPFLLSWNGLQLKKNSYQDGVYGTTCPIPPGKNYTYAIHLKDQIGSFFYFPSLAFHKAAGGFGALRILSRPGLPVPFPKPAKDLTFLIGDWYMGFMPNITRGQDHKTLKATLDRGHMLPLPDAVLINGLGVSNVSPLIVHKGKTYRFRISNVGLQHTLNFFIADHKLKLVEAEGTYTVQSVLTSLDVHIGQSYSVLVTMDQSPQNYSISVSTEFTETYHTTGIIMQYANSNHYKPPLAIKSTNKLDFSMKQARSIRTNPHGAYQYGKNKINRTVILENSGGLVKRKQRYAINGVSFVPADTPLKLADYFNISGVYKEGSIPDKPRGGGMSLETAVMGAHHGETLEIVFQNREKIIQSYHLDGYNFWVVGMEKGTWSPASRRKYNLKDAISRSTTQVYPNSWTAIYVAVDNAGMWNLRSEFWARQYLGQQFYLRVYYPYEAYGYEEEDPLPENALLCGRASNERSSTP